MHKDKVTLAILLTLMLLVSLVGIAFAESKTVSNVTGTTWDPGTDVYRSKTTSTFTAPWMSVHIRAYGFSPNPLKDQMSKSVYNSTNTGDVWVADIYAGPYPSYHAANTQYGGITFYTSISGVHSNWCWWTYGNYGGC